MRLTVRFRKAAQRLCRQEVISEKHSFTSSSPPVHTKVTMTVPGVQVQGLATERWLELRSRINDVLSQLDKMGLLCLAQGFPFSRPLLVGETAPHSTEKLGHLPVVHLQEETGSCKSYKFEAAILPSTLQLLETASQRHFSWKFV